MSFSKKLKTLRLENEMTQDYVASRLNVARSTIAGYETKNRQPSHEKLAALANLFHVTIDYLLEDDEVIHMALAQNDNLPPMEQNLLYKYKMLSSRSQKDLLEYIHLLELRDREQEATYHLIYSFTNLRYIYSLASCSWLSSNGKSVIGPYFLSNAL